MTKGERGDETDFRAQGNIEGEKAVSSARGMHMSQITDEHGNLKKNVTADDFDKLLQQNSDAQDEAEAEMEKEAKTGKGKKWRTAKAKLDALKTEAKKLESAKESLIASGGTMPNTELEGFSKGVEREARMALNQTIGKGKAVLGESDNQFMADIQKASAKDIIDQSITAKAAGKALNVSHDERGYIDGMSANSEYATGVKRGAEGQIEATKAKSQVRDDKGDKITDDEYAKNVKSGAIDSETKSQMNAKALREKFGDNLDGTYGGKTLTQTEKDRVAELEDSNKQLADKKKSLQKMTESGFVTGEGKNGAASVPASPAQLKEAKDEIAKLSTQMDSNNAELSKIGTDRAPMTAAEMHKVQAGAAIDGSIGKSQGIKDAMDKSKGGNADIYRQNAQYGELSNQLKTDAKIQAQGGVEKAANIDASESAIKSKEQMGALDGKVQELAKSGGVSAEEADKLGKKVAEGGATAAELMKAGILSSAQALASAQSGGKTAGDLAKLEEYNKNGDGGVDRFIASQKRQAIDAEAPKEAMLDFTDDKKRLSRKINDMKDEALDRGQFIQDAIREDMIEHDGKGNAKVDSDGNLIAKTGDNWVRGMAHLAAVSQEKSERIFMGGTGMNMRTDIGTGETLVDTNSGEASTRGHQLKQDYEMMAAMGVTGGDLEEAQKIVTTGGLTDHLSSKKAVASFVGNVGRGTANGIVEGLHATGAISDERYEQTKEWINESDSAGFVAVAAPGAVVTAELISRKPVELPQSRLDNLDPQKAGFYAQDGKTRVANADGYRLDEKGRPTQELMPEEELSKLKSQHEGYYKDGKMVANKEKKQVNAKGDEVKRGVISKSMGGSYRGLGRGKDALLDKFSPGTLATKQETGDASSDYQDAKDGKGSENSKSDKLHNNPPKNFIDKDILASIKDDVNPLQAKESLKGVSNENLAKQTLAERLHAKRIETMESGVLSPEEKSARLAKITSAENALGAENPRLNKTALVGNPKNPGIFSPKEFEQMGLSTGENGNTVDLEGSGENIRATKNDALTKAAAAAEASKPSEAPKAEPKAPSAAQQASQKVQLNEIAKQKASLDTDTPQGEADSKRLSQMEDYVKENGSLKGYAESNNVPQSTMKKYGLDNKSLDAIDKRTEVNYDKAELNKRPNPNREPTSSVKTDEAADAVKASDAPEVHGTTPDVPESKTGKVVGGLVTGAKELSKGAVIGAVIDVGANAASQTALDNGHFKTAAAAAYIGDIMSGAGNVIAGGVVGAAGAIDQGANALFGMKPIGSASKAIGLTDHDDMLKSANSFLSDAYDDALTATQNRHNLTEGNNQVSGMKAGEKTKAEKIYDWGKDVVGDEEPTKDESASLAGGGNTEQPKTKKMVTDSPAANDVLEADATIQSKSSADVGKEAVASLVNRAPESEARSNLIESMVNGGSATTQDLESIGVPKATVDQLPVNTDGTINEEALGDTIKGESAAIAKEMQQIVKRNTVIEEGEVTDNTAPLSIDTGDGTAATITDQVSAPAEVPISAKEAARAAEQNEAIQSLPSEVVGARTVQAFMDQAQTLAPQSFEQQQAVTQAMASGEPVIPSQLVSAGIPQQVVDAMPLTANGAVDVQGVGQQTQQMMQDATATQMNQAQQSEALSEYQQTQQGASSLDALSNLNDAVRQSQNVRTIDLPMLDGSTITGEVSQRADGAEISAQAEGRRDLYYANKSSNKTALESASASYMQLEDIREAILSQNAVEDEGGSAVDENSF